MELRPLSPGAQTGKKARLRKFSASALALLPILTPSSLNSIETAAWRPPAASPNVVLIVADDLGYGDLGSFGQKRIRTPNLDRMASEGMRLTRFYSGAPVCAPSRCVLMTGKHSGHAWIRDNSEVQPEGQKPLRAAEVTIAEVLRANGYATAAIGKWGLGPPGSEGDPNLQGFDLFYGYNCQRHAHNHYPRMLRRNSGLEHLPGNDGGPTGATYSHDLFEREALQFLDKGHEGPFFLYLPVTVPHAALQVPEDSLSEHEGKLEDAPYLGKEGYFPHRAPHAAYAAMVSRLDRTVGRILARLKEKRIERETLVIFTSDNGPTHGRVGGADSPFFRSAGGLRGLKGSVYEGGIRVPFIAWQPGTIPAGTSSDELAGFWDLMPTIADVASAELPPGTDGVSLAGLLSGRTRRLKERPLYWEFPGYGGQQALRAGRWKAVRQQMRQGPIRTELYDLIADPAEARDLAAVHGGLVKRMEREMSRMREPSALFPLPGVDRPGRN